MRPFALFVASLLAVPAIASAAAIVVPNSSFEAASGYWATPNWSASLESTSPTQYYVTQVVTSGATGVTGSNHLVISVDHNGVNDDNPTPVVPAVGSMGVVLSDTVGTFAANTVYTLTVAVGRGDNWSDWQEDGWAGIGLSSAPLTMAGLNANNSAMFNYSAFAADKALTDKTFVLSTAAQPGLVGQSIKVDLMFRSKMTYGRVAIFDNVRLDASPIPEPTSLSLLGLAGLLTLRRRR